MDLKFRYLRADEVECRVASVKQNGLVALLYKDARCDMNVLDETVGSMNWQRSHSRENKNCTVSIWDGEKNQWISKEDTGTESNTEAEKGLASDSFKRACFNWGIGRELYTAPFVWVPADKCYISGTKCYDKFKVTKMNVENGVITSLEIWNLSKKCKAFSFGEQKQEAKPETKTEEQLNQEMISNAENQKINAVMWNALKTQAEKKGITWQSILKNCGLRNGADMTVKTYKEVMDSLA